MKNLLLGKVSLFITVKLLEVLMRSKIQLLLSSTLSRRKYWAIKFMRLIATLKFLELGNTIEVLRGKLRKYKVVISVSWSMKNQVSSPRSFRSGTSIPSTAFKPNSKCWSSRKNSKSTSSSTMSWKTSTTATWKSTQEESSHLTTKMSWNSPSYNSVTLNATVKFLTQLIWKRPRDCLWKWSGLLWTRRKPVSWWQWRNKKLLPFTIWSKWSQWKKCWKLSKISMTKRISWWFNKLPSILASAKKISTLNYGRLVPEIYQTSILSWYHVVMFLQSKKRSGWRCVERKYLFLSL